MRATLSYAGWAFLVIVIAAGCGPKGAGGGGGKKGGFKGGGGAGTGMPQEEISAAAKETFQTAVDEYNMHESAKDWTPEACKKVAGLFEDASNEQPSGLAAAIFNAGLAFKRCGDDGEAQARFKQSLQMDPNYSPPRIMLGNYAFEAGDEAKAEKMYQDAIKGAPLALETVEAYVNLAQIQRVKPSGDKAKNQDEALKNLRRALAIDAQSMPAFTEMAYLYLDVAEKEKAKLALAEVVCVQAVKLDPNYAPIYNVWGLLKMRQGEIIDALKYFEKAYTLEPKMFEAYINFGSITIGFRGYEDAKDVFSKALDIKPDNYDAIINLGVALRGLEDYSGAEKQYLKALDLDKTRPEAYFNMGVLYQDYYLDKAGASGYENFQQAIEWYNKFKSRVGGKKGYEKYAEDADKRLETAKKAIEYVKEAATIMKEADKLQKEADAAEKAAAEKAAAEKAAAEKGGGGAKTPPAETPPAEKKEEKKDKKK
jgi:tetratricopeptide (TPR) repeat protein